MSEYTINLRSSILAGPTDLNVIVPFPKSGGSAREFYASGRKYKVLWLLHGGNGDRSDWLHSTNIRRFVLDREVIVVMPSALNSDFANHPQFADGYNFSDFFFDELMPFVHNWFPASDQPKDNFLAGVSMGAAGVWMYGLHRPEKFGGIAPISNSLKNYSFLEPYRALTAGEFRTRAIADRMAFPAGYGNPNAGIHVKEINMITKYPTVGDFLDSCECTWSRFAEVVAAGRLPPVYLPCSTEDRNYQKVLQLKEYSEQLRAKDITFDFISGLGNGFGFCDHVLPKILDFFNIK